MPLRANYQEHVEKTAIKNTEDADKAERKRIAEEKRTEKEKAEKEKAEKQAAQDDTLNEILLRDMPAEEMISELTDAIAGASRSVSVAVRNAKDRADELQKKLREEKNAAATAERDLKQRRKARSRKFDRMEAQEEREDRAEWEQGYVRQIMAVLESGGSKKRQRQEHAVLKILRAMEKEVVMATE